MSKMTRQQKREEERRIIAEFEAARAEDIKEQTDGAENMDCAESVEGVESAEGKKTPSREQIKKQKSEHGYDETMPQKVHCKRCKTLMEKGVCPTCGFRIYVPMSKEKRDKVRLIVTGVAMVVFLIVFVCLQFSKN